MLVSFYWRVTYELRLIPVHMMEKLFAPEEGVDAPRLQPVHHVLDEDAPRTMCNIVISCSGGQVRKYKLLQFTKLSKIATNVQISQGIHIPFKESPRVVLRGTDQHRQSHQPL